ncbi:MAG: SDR family NAD(P)-dependent oxidoreductase, partial [Candidatus Nanopelagicales bacterium]
MPRALITGPTSGIGQGFTRALAQQGHDLVLVSRDRARLQALAEEMQRTFGVAADILTADLTERGDIETVAQRLRDDQIDVLVNNAGFGVKGG